MDYSIARKALFSALSKALTKSLEFYNMDPTSSNFDVVTSVVEACSHSGMVLKPSHRNAVSAISHYEKPYYYAIDHLTGNVRYAIGGGIPDASEEPGHAKSVPTPAVTSEGNNGH